MRAVVVALGKELTKELTKLAEMTYRDVNIALVNEFVRSGLSRGRRAGHRRGTLDPDTWRSGGVRFRRIDRGP